MYPPDLFYQAGAHYETLLDAVPRGTHRSRSASGASGASTAASGASSAGGKAAKKKKKKKKRKPGSGDKDSEQGRPGVLSVALRSCKFADTVDCGRKDAPNLKTNLAPLAYQKNS